MFSSFVNSSTFQHNDWWRQDVFNPAVAKFSIVFRYLEIKPWGRLFSQFSHQTEANNIEDHCCESAPWKRKLDRDQTHDFRLYSTGSRLAFHRTENRWLRPSSFGPRLYATDILPCVECTVSRPGFACACLFHSRLRPYLPSRFARQIFDTGVACGMASKLNFVIRFFLSPFRRRNVGHWGEVVYGVDAFGIADRGW